ncbi:helix-turn-helix domain-containing protein [Cohnella sp. GCM10027633]|uniref:helix-turn-helix domain-containing protein n=1 Tax=unclassified Cohnella TaxID=2636738 RepID=UPI003636213D
MTTTYVSIMMKHFEQMQIEVAAAAETVIGADSAEAKEAVFDCNRFVWIAKGEGRLHMQGKTLPIASGTLCVLLSGIAHRFEPAPGTTLTVQWVHFRASYEDRDLYRSLSLPSVTQVASFGEVASVFERIFEYLGHERLTSRLRLKSLMLELISAYIDNLSIDANEKAPSHDLQKIEAVIQYIDNHLADNITVEELAKQVYLHPNYFIMFFKGMMGYSPIQYVNQRRMETAKGLLLQPECNVSAVANKVGMQIYYFSRMFKSHTGLSPSRFRKQGTMNFIAATGEGV